MRFVLSFFIEKIRILREMQKEVRMKKVMSRVLAVVICLAMVIESQAVSIFAEEIESITDDAAVINDIGLSYENSTDISEERQKSEEDLMSNNTEELPDNIFSHDNLFEESNNTVSDNLVSYEGTILTSDTLENPEGSGLDGNGTEESPYIIKTPSDLAAMADNLSAYYELGNDIDLSEYGKWTPIGDSPNYFTGHFNGNKHKIFNISTTDGEGGIWGYLKNATIENTIIIASPNKTVACQGLLCNQAYSTTISNCFVAGNLYSSIGAGGILACYAEGHISNCQVQGFLTVAGTADYQSSIGNAGGIVGSTNGPLVIENCSSFASIKINKNTSSRTNLGGICGSGVAPGYFNDYNGWPEINNCYFKGELHTNDRDLKGSICATNSRKINNSYYYYLPELTYSNSYGEGKSLSDLQKKTTYKNWDFDSTWICDQNTNVGMPSLRWMAEIDNNVFDDQICPTCIGFSEATGQVIFSQNNSFSLLYDREINANPNGDIYVLDKNTSARINCSYSIENGNKLVVSTNDVLTRGHSYKFQMSDFVYDANHSTLYSRCTKENTFEFSVSSIVFEGEGTENNPYKVSTVAQLNILYEQPSKCYILTNDIDVSSLAALNSIGERKQSAYWTTYNGTGGRENPFTGIFDGAGHKIYGIKDYKGNNITGQQYNSYPALFSSTDGAIIKNLNIELADDFHHYDVREASFTSNYYWPCVAGIVAKGTGTISQCSVTGSLHTAQYTSYTGLIAGDFSGEITKCYAIGEVNGTGISSEQKTTYAGGLIGYFRAGTVRDCFSWTSVNGSTSGGLLGHNGGFVERTYSVGKVVGSENRVGGLVGINQGNISVSYYNQTVSGQNDHSGKGEPKSTVEMKNKDTYEGFDFENTWECFEGSYPILSMFNYNTDKLPELIREGKYRFRVIDENNNPLKGVRITAKFSEESIQEHITDKNGFADFDINLSWGLPSIQATKATYMTWTNENMNWNYRSNRYEEICMYPSSNKYKYRIKSVRYESSQRAEEIAANIRKEYPDLLRETKTLYISNESTINTNYDFKLQCVAWNPGLVKSFKIYQDERIIAYSNDGNFDLNTYMFRKGGNCGVLVEPTDGSTSIKTPINLKFADKQEELVEFSIGKSTKFSIGQNVPIYGGKELSFDFPCLPVDVLFTDEKIHIGINQKGFETIKDEEKFDEMKKKLASAFNSNLSLGKKGGLKEYVKEYKNGDLPGFEKGESKPSMNMVGYLEGRSDDNIVTGQIYIEISAKANPDWTFVVGVPIVVDLEISVDAKTGGELTYNWSTNCFNGRIFFNPKAGIEIFSGIGVGKAVGVGVYGGGNIQFQINLADANGNIGLRKVDMTGEFGGKAYFGPFEYKDAWAYQTWNLYTATDSIGHTNETNYANEMAVNDILNENIDTKFDYKQIYNYYRSDLSYIANESKWKGNLKEDFTVAEKNESSFTDYIDNPEYITESPFEALLEKTYQNTSPVVASDGENAWMAFLRVEKNTGDIYVALSRYDGNTGVWSEPKRVNENAVMDDMPDLVCSGDDLWLVYSEATSGYNRTSDDILNYVRNRQIRLNKIDKDTCEISESKTYVGNGFLSNQKFSLVDGRPVMAYSDSMLTDEDSIFMSQNTKIFMVDLSTTEKEQVKYVETSSPVCQIVPGKHNGTLCVGYVTSDGDFYEGQGSDPTLLSHGVNGRISYTAIPGKEESGFMWNDSDSLCLISGEKISATGITECYDIDDGVLVYSAVSGENNYKTVLKQAVIGDNSTECASIIKCFDSKYFENINMFTINGRKYIVGMNTTADIGYNDIDISKDLVWTKMNEVHDIRISGIDFDETIITTGEKVPVTLSVTNEGEKPVSNIEISVNGSVIATNSTNIQPGETANIDFDIDCPEDTVTYGISIAEPGIIESSERIGDNTTYMTVKSPDMSVEVDFIMNNEQKGLEITVRNDGGGKTKGKLTVYDKNGDVYYTKETEEIGADEVEVVNIWVPEESEDKFTGKVTVGLEEIESDLYEFNNKVATNADWNNEGNPESEPVAMGQATAPSATPVMGKPVKATDKIKLSTRTQNAVIYYTTDGTMPTLDSNIYENPIEVADIAINNKVTIKAFSIADGKSQSDISIFAWTIGEIGDPVILNTAAPVAVPESGSQIKETTEIILNSDTDNAVIYYTIDGSIPTESSYVYRGPIQVSTVAVNGKVTIKAIAVAEGYRNSDISVFTWTVQNNTENPKDNEIVPGDLPAGEKIPSGLWTGVIANPNSKDGLYYYTGEEIKPEVRVYDGSHRLKPNTDYTVKYMNNKKSFTLSKDDDGFFYQNGKTSAPTITVKGKGNYSSKETIYFKILPQNISGIDFYADDIAISYNKKKQKVFANLYWKSKTLKSGNDYEFTVYKADDIGRTNSLGTSVKDTGDYVIRFTGINNFTGTREVNLKVSADYIPVGKLSVGKIKDIKYTGNEITPEPIIKDGKKLLVKDTHYTLSYKTNTAVGTGFVLITGKPENGYSGTRRVAFKIIGTPVKNAVISGLPKTASYTGNEIKYETDVLKLYIKANKKTPQIDLVRDKDYSLSYSNNINTGKATIVLKGKGGYTGTVKKTLKINPFDISSNADIEGRFVINCAATAVYSKGGAKPEISASFKNADGSIQELVAGKDYTVSYKNNTSVGGTKKPIAIVSGKGNFKGKRNCEFAIITKDISSVTLNAVDIVFKNKINTYSTKVSLVDTDGKALKAGTDYEKKLKYTYLNDTEVQVNGSAETRLAGTEVGTKDIIPAGTTIKVTATAKGNYTDTVSGTYRITKASLASASVGNIAAQVYTGKPITLDPSTLIVMMKKTKLNLYDDITKEGDFVVKSYSNNTKVGTATITLQGVGNYGGTKTVKFKINAKGFRWWWRK